MASAPECAGLDQQRRVLKPAIKELLRTQVCIEPLEFLVDRIHIVSVHKSGKARQAYRLWLSDGSRSIQAILKSEIHPFIGPEEVQEGSYVLVTKYELVSSKRRQGEGEVRVLKVEYLEAIGFDGRPFQAPRLETSESSTNYSERKATSSAMPDDLETSLLGSSLCNRKVGSKDDRLEDSLGANATNTINYVTSKHSSEQPAKQHSVDVPRNLKRRRSIVLSPLRSVSGNGTDNSTKALKIVNTELSADMTSDDDYDPSSSTLRPISRCLKIIPLSNLIGPRITRNKVHDVLAVICSVDPDVIKRRSMPDQRNIRIMDASTTKRVQLTVFVDAASFAPAVGTVALFRNVTTHEWDGGSLKAYQRDCGGRRWYIPNPTELEKGRIDHLETYWRSMQHGH